VTKLFESDLRGQCSGEDANGDGRLSSGDLPFIIRVLPP